MINVNL